MPKLMDEKKVISFRAKPELVAWLGSGGNQPGGTLSPHKVAARLVFEQYLQHRSGRKPGTIHYLPCQSEQVADLVFKLTALKNELNGAGNNINQIAMKLNLLAAEEDDVEAPSRIELAAAVSDFKDKSNSLGGLIAEARTVVREFAQFEQALGLAS